jgi:type II secretory pathway pseudopilin PulG
LVELLVVFAALAVLASLLLPAMHASSENARRGRCMNNLKRLGFAATMHAQDKDDWLPQAYRTHNSLHMMPDFWDDDSHFADDSLTLAAADCDEQPVPGVGQWKRNGTPWRAGWAQYGMTLDVLECPSVESRSGWWIGEAGRAARRFEANNSCWGTGYYACYMWLPGIQNSRHGSPGLNNPGGGYERGHDGEARLRPPLRIKDADPAISLLGGDVVNYIASEDRHNINHGSRIPGLPGFQNLLFADGRVAGFGPAHYRAPLSGSNYSAAHRRGDVFYYWQQQ